MIDEEPTDVVSLEVKLDEDDEVFVVKLKSSGKQFAGVPHRFNIAYILSMFMLFPEALEKELA